ncbi:hypothetical protein AVEN_205468-1 [Araneus ventricosus]|uniref:Uncharacterized protein n=1 Tax=Araneus ventricosus TaxID=182803 RepID=A0A4Y2CEQ1_ARAVE|nr:hypothetical protein AVEN_205468-1 [Araneus ventricosus]
MIFVPVTTRWLSDTHATTARCHGGQESETEREREVSSVAPAKERSQSPATDHTRWSSTSIISVRSDTSELSAAYTL